ncbi:AAA family ATPase [Altererythrobacter arenosus]|uniref:AAA family ATPase n=1 Tax=Altererythrobacter arenosus TaxID=3032592 RepID=A0ABY8FR87_9SPHN|nr:AAA family ATPase [Altererythrobacter sp. CAU 1644]WFL76625.1 AAA family ATPase [Altererythrobacter sp. CAU 1644]
MGRIDNIYEPPLNQAVDLPEHVHIVAQPAVLDGIDPIRDDVKLIECGVDDPLPIHSLVNASIVVIEVDPRSRNSLERVDQLRKHAPSVPVIAGLGDVDIATTRQLLRRGVSDIVALPFALDELVTSIVDVADKIELDVADQVAPAPFITVLKSIGGSGATTVITHLAAQMTSDLGEGARSCIIDLDLQSGDVASYMGVAPRRTLADLIESTDRVDEEVISSVAASGHHNVDVIAAPTDIVPIESLEFDQLMMIVTLARKRYDLVFVDLPANMTNWSLSTIFAADQTLVIGQLTIPSLRHAKRQIDFLVSMGIPRDKIQVALNRVEKRLFKTIDASDAAGALKHPILATIGEDANLLRTAQDQGELVDAFQKRSKFNRDIMQLADLVADRLAELN